MSDTPAMQALEVKRDEKSQKLQIDFNYKLLGDEKFTVTEADVRGANDIKNAINKYLIKINDFNNNFIATELNRIKTESNGDAGSKETTALVLAAAIDYAAEKWGKNLDFLEKTTYQLKDGLGLLEGRNIELGQVMARPLPLP